ncbi:DNA polymerase III subunit chi [Chitinivorax sp. B]|uniref:DNA polymerase III subunit chi n=1 Tax=Chitinivorax sp. B TaxID=2502235 RepID=UPI0010F7FCBC|nr:DNA polymerase III subunit chi [Chitinivorax sp. B]
MTRIDFYTHVEDRAGVVCQLAAKAVSQGKRVMIFTAGPAETDLIDQRLWTFNQLSFIPHCRANHELAAETPVIVDHVAETLPHHEILINLHPDWPRFFSRFERLIEIVSQQPDITDAARQRFRYYRDCGYDIQSHNLSHLGS